MKPEEVQALRVKEDSDAHVREATGVLLFVEKPDAFITKKCDECKGMFATTYQFVSVCSTSCRIRSLKKIGIDWNPLHTPEERWQRSKIPTEYSIPPRALRILLEMAEEQKLQEPIDASIYAPSESPQSNGQSYNDPPVFVDVELPTPKDSQVEDLLGEFGLSEFL